LSSARAQIFVASSVEGKPYASAIARVLRAEGAEPVVWWGSASFPANRTLIESLEHLTTQVDGALIVATPDDRTIRRGIAVLSPSVNVFLEYGLFVGHLGRRGVAIVKVEDPQLPSDLGGVVCLSIRSIDENEDEATYTIQHLSWSSPSAPGYAASMF
jgi:predicted nucleotide-binding protein